MPMRKKSFIWQHFTQVHCENNKVACNHCQRSLTYTLTTMSNLHRHLRTKHPEMAKGETGETVEVYTEQEVVEEITTVTSLPAYEITLKGFEEMEQDTDESKREYRDANWTPETAEEWKPHQTTEIVTSEIKKEKKSQKRSAVWDHFLKSESKTSAQCYHCGKVIKLGTISNLARHMRLKHPNAVANIIQTNDENHNKDQDVLRNQAAICTEVIEINVDDMQNPINIIETKTDELGVVEEIQFQYDDELHETNVTQSSQTEFLDDSEDFDMHDYIRPKRRAILAEHVDRQLVKMIVKGCHPVGIVEQQEFRQFVNLLHPKYELPTVKKLALELIPDIYQECEKKTNKGLQAAEGICLFIDQWKSKSSNYMCITANFINTECKLETSFLACHILPMTEDASGVTERLMRTVTDDWNVGDKVVAVVTDNTDIISSAVSLCNWPHVPHFVRALSLVVHESLQAIKSLLFKVRNIIGEIIKTPEVIAEIYSTQKMFKLPSVKLITKVRNDWSCSFSTLEMLSRFVTLRQAISHTLQKYSWSKLSENEWKILKGVVEILGVFKSVKKEVMVGRIILSKVGFYIKVLKREMKAFQRMPNEANCVATVAETALNEQFRDLDQSDLVPTVLLLDPRLKKHVFDDESEFASACSHLKKELCEVVLPEPEYREPNTSSFWNTFDMEVKKMNAVKDPIGKGILELENYLQEQLLGRDEDPFVWWEQRCAIYPRLFKLAKKYLCVTVKSSTQESISFSSAHMLSSLKYSESSPTELEMMFLHHNM